MDVQGRPAKQLQTLQLLRALAATSVVYFHTFNSPHIGSFGVDLFFVISGLVISMVSESASGWQSFMSDRLTRIVPLYWALTTVQISAAWLGPDLLNSTTGNVVNYLKSIFFIPYFKENGSLTPVLPVGWTLNYEMLFYVLAAISIAFVPRKAFFRWTALLVLIVWGVGHLLPSTLAETRFLRSDQLLEFVFGMIAWKSRAWGAWGRNWLFPAVLAIVALYASMGYTESTGDYIRSLAYGLPSFAIVALALRLDPALENAPSYLIGVLKHVGDASYSTYLSHLFVIEFLRKIVASRFPILAPDTWVGALASIAVCLAVGSMLYLIVDRNLVRALRKVSRRWNRIKAGPKAASQFSQAQPDSR